MFQVPKRAGGHPRTVIAVLAVVLLGLSGWAGYHLMGRVLPTVDAAEAAEAPPPKPPVVVIQALPQLADRLTREGEAGRFMGAVLVARGDQVLFRQVYGQADYEADRPLNLDTPFRLASISKQFTAVALLKLQDEGKLSLTDPVCRWIQPCPDAWAPLTLSHLVSHTSGIPDLMARPAWGLRRVTPATLDELTIDSAQYRLAFEPGTRVRYNNAGFNLAADVIERASGQPFDTYLQTALFDPIGMSRTGLGDAPYGAMGYANFPGGLTPQPNANVSIVIGAGAIYSTLDDMLAWSRALHGGEILSSASYQQFLADHAPDDTPSERGRPRRDYGYGVFTNRLGQRVSPQFHERQIYHTGSWSGFRNLMTYQPDAEVTVIVLSNNYHSREQVFLISQQAMAEALGHDFPAAGRE